MKKTKTNDSITINEFELKKLANHEFKSHTSPLASWLYSLSDWLMAPVTHAGVLALTVFVPQTRAHAHPNVELRNILRSDSTLLAVTTRLLIGIAATVTFLCAAVTLLPIAKLLRFIVNNSKNDISYLRNDKLWTVTINEQDAFHAVTYNTALLHPIPSVLSNLRFPLVRASAVSKILMNLSSQSVNELIPHFVLLQEVFSYDAMRGLCYVLRRDYPHILYDIFPGEKRRGSGLGINFGALGIGSGLLFASRCKIVAVKFVKFPNDTINFLRGGQDVLEQKGVLMVVTEPMPGKYLLVCNAHLQSKSFPSCIEQRARQLEIIDREVWKFKCHLETDGITINNKIMLGGDFNIADQYSREEKGGLGDRGINRYKVFFDNWNDAFKNATVLPATWTTLAGDIVPKVIISTVDPAIKQVKRVLERVVEEGVNYDRFFVCNYAQRVEKLERAEQLARLERSLRAGSPLSYNDAFVVPDGEPTAASDHLALVGEFNWRAPAATPPTFA